MAKKQSQFPETDLDKTDQLPILQDATWDHDVEDDAVRMDHTAVLPTPPSLAAGASDFVRPSGVDLPSLAESVRSVEERIARQNAEFEALTRAYERSRDTEAAAVARANTLAVDLGSARAALESEQRRLGDTEKALAERSAAVEAARVRVEDAVRESERHQGESRTLRESLAARETTITQVLHSLGERDAQLALLQSEHAKIVPVLEASSKSTAQLDAELQASRARVNALTLELQASRDAEAALAAQLKRAESELGCCGPANGAGASIRIYSANWTLRSVPPTWAPVRSNRSAIGCRLGSRPWKRNRRRRSRLRTQNVPGSPPKWRRATGRLPRRASAAPAMLRNWRRCWKPPNCGRLNMPRNLRPCAASRRRRSSDCRPRRRRAIRR
jgi:hypothetical protein